MHIKFFLCLILFLIPNSILTAQEIPDKPVAKIGNILISKKEFIARYELTPISYKHMKNNEEALKKNFLYSLIAEKLLALEAEENNIDTSEIVQYNLDHFKKMFTRDELYRKEIVEKSRHLAYSLLDKYIKNPSSIFVKYISADDKSEVENIYNLLEKNVPFDSLYVELSPADTSKMNIRFGQLDEKTENQLFNLNENNYSNPVEINNTWFIFKVIKRNFAISDKSDDWQTIYRTMEKTAKERAEETYYENFRKKFFSNKKVEANGFLLKSLAENIISILAQKNPQKLNGNFYLDINDLLKIESNLGNDTLNMVYIKFESKNITLKNFIRNFMFNFFNTKKIDFNIVTSILNKKTKEFIERELLAEEGFKRGFQDTKDVKQSYKLWRDNYFSQLIQEKLIDTTKITDEEAFAYYTAEKNGDAVYSQVNVIEVLTHDLETAEKVLNELNNGKDISEIAKLYSVRDFTKATNGAFGYFPVNMYGDIGRIAAKMEIGEVYGPLKIKEGYSIFKVIGKKDVSIKPSQSFEKIKDDIKKELNYIRMQNKLNANIVELANKYNVEINFDVLNDLNVTNVNAFAYRLLGFGGKIAAVPLVIPHSDWVELWQKSAKSLP